MFSIKNIFHIFLIDDRTAWTGWWDEAKEGEIVPISVTEPLSIQSFAPWRHGQPDGSIYENCVALGKDGQWSDHFCHSKACVACQIPTTPTFVMRGKTGWNYKQYCILPSFNFWYVFRTLFWIFI